ncbi:hypothetical protein N7456_008726 [Penicillium angulare]|uniref:Uncharacterized protein n=1 Tax=Penicillium angulare TaxID=116970 RepID=A0A9W9K4T9_9EURO|nr:hypothetical protein N7456_008726 [Penicillium angulare]
MAPNRPNFGPKVLFTSPVWMIVTLVLAIVIAVGHHAFFQYLNGRAVHAESNSTSHAASFHISDQQLNTSIGILLALLVKGLLGASITAAFDQCAWKELIKGRRVKIGLIDDLFIVLRNGLMILNFGLWRQYSLAMLLGTTIWLLPIASIITPGTLNVALSPTNSSLYTRVPRVDFTSMNFVNLESETVNGVTKRDATVVPDLYFEETYMSPSSEVESVVSSSAMQGRVLSVDAPAVNASWKLDFHGPAINCSTVNQTLGNAITDDVISTINASASLASGTSGRSLAAYGFLSWVPYDSSLNGSLPFYGVNKWSSTTPTPRYSYIGPTTGSERKNSSTRGDVSWSDSSSPLSFFVATFPHMQELSYKDASSMWRTALDPNVVQCTLHNASYGVDFTVENGKTEAHITKRELLNSIEYMDTIRVKATSSTRSDAELEDEMKSYQEIYEFLSYQAVMESFSRLLVGSITGTFSEQNSTNTSSDSGSNVLKPNMTNLNVGSGVMLTTLSNTKELALIKASSNQVDARDSFATSWLKNSADQQATNNASPSILEALEEMFQNTTLSLMSSPSFQPNYSLSASPGNISVTISSYETVYTYSKAIFWTAYGIAIGVTLIGVALGLYAYTVNHGSYVTNFSTILRVIQNANIEIPLQAEDCSGKEPIPGSIANAMISFAQECRREVAFEQTRDTTAINDDPPPYISIRGLPDDVHYSEDHDNDTEEGGHEGHDNIEMEEAHEPVSPLSSWGATTMSRVSSLDRQIRQHF